MQGHGSRNIFAVLALWTVVAAAPARAQAPPTPPNQNPQASAPAVNADERIRQLEQKLIQADRLISQLAAELQSLKATAGGSPAPAGTPTAQAPGIRKVGPNASGAPVPSPAPTPAPGPEIARRGGPPGPAPLPEEEATIRPTEEEPEFTPAFLREARAVLIRRGRLEVATGVNFTRTDRNFIAARGLDILENFFVGPLLIGEVNRSAIRPNISVRYGLADRLQLNASVPYSFQYSEQYLPPQIVRIRENESGDIEIQDESYDKEWNWGIGDVDFGFSYHLFRSRRYLPDTIVSFAYKTKTGVSPFDVPTGGASTGTGFTGIRGGMTMVWVSDPASIFTNIGYFYHMGDEVNGVDIDPADSINVGAGIAYSLNPFISISTAVNTRFVSDIKLDGQDLPGSGQQTAELALGVAYGWGKNRSIDVSLGVGLTNDSPDFSFGISMPFTFDPWVPWKDWDYGPLRRVLSF